jgi:hypothetical protein
MGKGFRVSAQEQRRDGGANWANHSAGGREKHRRMKSIWAAGGKCIFAGTDSTVEICRDW